MLQVFVQMNINVQTHEVAMWFAVAGVSNNWAVADRLWLMRWTWVCFGIQTSMQVAAAPLTDFLTWCKWRLG